ncbi:ATP-grasp domain-containing protein [Asanoa iriomotensis]|uniref:ATP-grasp fold PylC-type domain-containing protein n=1 Tax=Asanoa iriomotensis TaxID=234613 RepID=A0ABQ4CDX3_9ACTN|nr:ATP-grasp domain-containing protein [Asanoa iriomotensis]GIF60977.1 hypothetical protein Air01nite_70720 [Asanoa iriomotensis]
MRRFLVTGAGGPAGRALLAALTRRGFPATGVDAAPDAPEVETVPFADHPCFVAEVLRAAARHRAGIVVPTVSEELPPLAAAALGRTGGPRIVVGTPAAVAAAADKWRTARLLDLAGVPVPRTLLAGWPEPERLGSPFLSKPRRGRGGRGVRLHGTPGAFPPPMDDDHILQEYAPGAEYAVDLYADTVVVLRKTLLRQGLVGNAVSVRRESAPDVADVARAAVATLGLTGPVDVDVRRRADGTPLVLEVNARFGALSGHAPEVLDALLADYP